MPDGQEVQFQSPTTGAIQAVPPEHWDEALSQGYKPTTHKVMYSPDGQRGMVPNEQLAEKMHAGYQTTPKTQFEQNRDPNNRLGFLSNFGTATKNLVGGIFNMPTNPVAAAVAGQRVAMQLAADDIQRQQEGRSRAYRGVATVGSTLGVPARQMEEAADVGDTSGVLGAATPVAALAAMPAVLRRVAPWAAKATAPLRSSLAQKTVSPLVYENVGEAAADTRTGISPERGITDEGLVGTRENLLEQSKARVTELKNAANNILENHPNSHRIIDAEPHIDAAIDEATQQTRKVAGSTERLENLRTALKTQYGKLQGTPIEINNLKTDIQNAANEVGAYRNTEPGAGSIADAMKDVASRIRRNVNDIVPEAADLNNRMANSIDAQAGLQKGISAEKGRSIFGGFHEGALSKALNRTAGSAPVRTGLARILNLGNTLDIPAPMSKLPFIPRGLFDKPATPMGWGEPDTSGSIRGGRWTTPAAFLPEPEPIEAEFIPRRMPFDPPFRANVNRMLPSGELPTTNIPPIPEEKFSIEGPASNPNAIGPRGRGGVRVEEGEIQGPQRPKRPIKGLLSWKKRR